MGLLDLFILAVGLSMDAFAVSIITGLTMQKATLKKSFIVGLYFGVFQAMMPLIGYLVGTLFAEKIYAYDHWIALVLLSFLGVKMIIDSLKKEGCPDRECPAADTCPDRNCPGGEKPIQKEAPLTPAHMLPLAVATSIDALAVGVSFAFLLRGAQIVPAVSFIGVTTCALSVLGVRIGRVFGLKFKSKATFVGGVILIAIGVKILIEHIFIK
ncbi:MAG: manganese efflux pump MntP family protein [Clostridiales bacterium]|jgi:putative Mn2+ efflux pump MntP|nr:manganese efflux pump MntP family protein [Clostridiales bacterium]